MFSRSRKTAAAETVWTSYYCSALDHGPMKIYTIPLCYITILAPVIEE